MTLLFSIQCVPIFFWMWLFFLNAVVGLNAVLKIHLKFSFICKIFQWFLMVLVIFGRNLLYVITSGILWFLTCVFSVTRSILLVGWSFQDICWLIMKLTLVIRSCFSFPWGYYLNLLDLNLFTWFVWLNCKVNYVTMILGIQILC